MKPFNLKAALEGAPVVTRNGCEVKDLAYMPSRNSAYKVLGTLNGNISAWGTDGREVIGTLSEQSGDLFMAAAKKTLWVNVYETNGACVYAYESEDEANTAGTRMRTDRRLGQRAWPLEIEE